MFWCLNNQRRPRAINQSKRQTEKEHRSGKKERKEGAIVVGFELNFVAGSAELIVESLNWFVWCNFSSFCLDLSSSAASFALNSSLTSASARIGSAVRTFTCFFFSCYYVLLATGDELKRGIIEPIAAT